MIGTLFAAFGGASIVTKLIAVGAVAMILLGLYGVWHAKVFNNGVAYAVAKIAANDAKLVARAKKARGVLLECQIAGKSWDQSTGECR